MRVAPVGLVFWKDPERAFQVGCDVAAITHGHPSGYLSAGCLCSIIACVLQGKEPVDGVDQTLSLLKRWPSHQETLEAVEKALSSYGTQEPTPERIEQLGQGWTGEEALSISLFCALHFQKDYKGGVLAAINHSGDSDSTGAITGNLLGAYQGRGALPEEWVQHLEMADIVEQVGLDLFIGAKGNGQQNDGWAERYPSY
jgi:ADP-ribosylglycohydrolase